MVCGGRSGLVIIADELAAAEMRSLLSFACGFCLDKTNMRNIYEVVGREIAKITAEDTG